MRRALFVGVLLSCALAGAAVRTGRHSKGKAFHPGTAIRLLPVGGQSQECAGSLAGSFGQTITFTRATTQHCTNSSGTLVLVASGTPALEATGVLIEPAATNLSVRSAAFDNATWTKIGSGSTPTVTADSADCGNAPDGTQTAEKVAFPAVSGASSYALLRQGGVATPTATYTTSLWMKTTAGTATLYFGLAGFDNMAAASITTTWTRFSVSQAINVNPRSFDIGVNRFELNQADQVAQTVCVWGGQVESGSAATTQIPTAAATATRNVTLASADILGSLSNAAGCAAATITVGASVPSAGRIIGFGSNNAALVVNSLTEIAIIDGTNTVAKTVTSLANRTVRLRATWSGTTSTLEATGEADVTTGTYDEDIKGAGSTVNGASAFRGRISNVVLGTTSTGCPL
jgi:hypothetical protein